MTLVGLIIAGIIIGLLGKFVAPGDRDNIPIWLTVLCGIAGVLVGYFALEAINSGSTETDGVDWVQWIVSIVLAAVFVMIASTVTGRNSGRSVSR